MKEDPLWLTVVVAVVYGVSAAVVLLFALAVGLAFAAVVLPGVVDVLIRF